MWVVNALARRFKGKDRDQPEAKKNSQEAEKTRDTPKCRNMSQWEDK